MSNASPHERYRMTDAAAVKRVMGKRTLMPASAWMRTLLRSRPKDTAIAVIDTRAPMAPTKATARLVFMAKSAETKKVLSPSSLHLSEHTEKEYTLKSSGTRLMFG